MARTGVHNYTSADRAAGRGRAQAPSQSKSATGKGFLKGVRGMSKTVEVKPGIWGEGTAKPGPAC